MQPEQPKHQPRRVGGKIVAVVIVVVIVVVALGLDLTGALSSSPPLPLAVTTAPLCSVDINATLPCGYSGGGSQGIFVVTAASIALSKSNDGSGTLTFTLVHTGVYAGSGLYALVSPLGVNHYVQVMRLLATGRTQNCTASIPSSFGLVGGQRYSVTVESLYNTENQSGLVQEIIFAVTAS